MSNLKLEVGKRYAMEGGDVVFIFRVDLGGDFHGISPGSGVRYWRPDGTSDHYQAITRCLDDEPELVDLTKIDVPFGKLDERTQDRLAGAVARGSALEFKSRDSHRWHDIKRRPPGWFDIDVYRIKPTYTMPSVDDKVWQGMPRAKAIAWDEDDMTYAYTKMPWRGLHAWVCELEEMTRINEALFGDLIRRGDCPWDQAIVLRPEGL